MSVLIRGMEMPKACYECRMYEADIYYCAAAERDINISSSDEGRCSFCPLVHVPPHGDLIDADKLVELCDIMADKCDGVGASIWHQFKTTVEWSPIVIPEEEGE